MRNESQAYILIYVEMTFCVVAHLGGIYDYSLYCFSVVLVFIFLGVCLQFNMRTWKFTRNTHKQEQWWSINGKPNHP